MIKPLFLKGPALGFRLLVLLLLSVVLMTLDHRQTHLETVRSALSVIVYPLQSLINLPVEVGRWVKQSLVTQKALLEKNARLRRENLLLRLRSQKFAALEAENMHLRELLGSSMEAGGQAIVAEVLAVQLEPSTRQILLNKGSQQGVYIGQPIVDAHGIMGQVIHIGPVFCSGMLITDVSHAIPVQINRNGLRAIAIGTGSWNRLELAYIPINADVRKGDLIISSGMDGRFPAGYPVGEITDIESDPNEPFVKITATPSAHLERAREVLLIWPHTPSISIPRIAGEVRAGG